MDDEKDFILIEEYLDGTLGGNALRDFELRLKDDKELAEEVAIYQEVNERFAAMTEKKAMQTQWKKVIESATTGAETSGKVVSMPKAKTRTIGFYLVRIASVLVVGFGLYFLIPQSNSTDQLAMNYWEETAQIQFIGGEKGGVNSTQFLEDLKNAYNNFEQKKYTKTIEILNDLTPQTNEVLLLKGATYFQSGDSENAIQSFQKILNQDSKNDEAPWYLALSYLQKKDSENAKPILENIMKNQSWQHRKAAKLLQEIE